MQIRQRKDGLLEPLWEKDKPLFEHCAGGLCAVTEEYFWRVVYGLIRVHVDNNTRFSVFGFYDHNDKPITCKEIKRNAEHHHSHEAGYRKEVED